MYLISSDLLVILDAQINACVPAWLTHVITQFHFITLSTPLGFPCFYYYVFCFHYSVPSISSWFPLISFVLASVQQRCSVMIIYSKAQQRSESEIYYLLVVVKDNWFSFASWSSRCGTPSADSWSFLNYHMKVSWIINQYTLACHHPGHGLLVYVGQGETH